MKKKILWSVASFLVLFALVAVLGPALMSTEEASTYLTREIFKTTGAQVQLGQVKVRFWPRIEIVQGPGELLSLGENTDIAELRWRSLEGALALGPLIRGRMEVGAVTLAGLVTSGRIGKHHFGIYDGGIQAKDLEFKFVNNPDSGSLFCRDPVPLSVVALQAEYDGVIFDKFRAEGQVYEGVLDFARIEAQIGTGSVGGNCRLSFADDNQVAVDFQSQLHAVAISSILQGQAPEIGRRWEGTLDAEGEGKFLVVDQVLVPESLDLEGKLVGENGVIHAGDWLDDIKPYLGARQDLTDIRYKNLVQDFRVQAGKYQLEFALEGQDTDWSGTGWIGLDGTLAVDLQVTLPPGFTPDLGSWSQLASTLKDKDGRITLALKLTGRTTRPTIALDLVRTLGGAGHGVDQVLGKGLGGLLDKWKVR